MRSTPPFGSSRASPPLAAPQSCRWPSGSGSSPMGSRAGQAPVCEVVFFSKCHMDFFHNSYRAGLSIGRKVLKVMFLGVPPACFGSR